MTSSGGGASAQGRKSVHDVIFHCGGKIIGIFKLRGATDRKAMGAIISRSHSHSGHSSSLSIQIGEMFCCDRQSCIFIF